MAALLSVEEWKDLTSIMFSRRGPRLRAVDDALDAYHRRPNSESLLYLIQMLEIYKQTRPGGWEGYVRNQRKGIQILMSQLFGLAHTDDAILDASKDPYFGIEAWAIEGTDGSDLADVLREGRQQALQALFSGRTLEMKRYDFAFDSLTQAASLGSSAKKVFVSASSTSAAGAFQGTAGTIGKQFLSDLHLTPGDVVAMTPLIGIISDLIVSGWEWKSFYDLVCFKERIPAFQAGLATDADAIKAAIDGVGAYVDARLRLQGIVAGAYSSGLAMKLISTSADGGAGSHVGIALATKAVVTVAKLMFAWEQYREMKAAQAVLADKSKMGIELFQTCPLLGCYMVACCSQSDLINIFDDRRMLSKYWREEAVYLVRKTDTLREKCRTFIDESYIELVGPETEYRTAKNYFVSLANRYRPQWMTSAKRYLGRAGGIGSEDIIPVDTTDIDDDWVDIEVAPPKSGSEPQTGPRAASAPVTYGKRRSAG